MSHSSSTTVINNQTDIVINIINTGVRNGTLPGLSEIPAGSKAAAVETALVKGLEDALASEWKSAFPNTPEPAGSPDIAFLIGPALLTTDMKVPNAVDAINNYLNNKNIVTSEGFAENTVHTVLLELIQAGGIVNTTSGTDILGPLQKTDWAIVTAPGKFGSGKDAGTLIAYALVAGPAA